MMGPFELLRHAAEHAAIDTDVDRRIALIGFDQAVEVAVDVFLKLHPMMRGGYEITRDVKEKASANFPAKVSFLAAFAEANNRALLVSAAVMLFYHQIRNSLYHEGNGVTPERFVVEGAQAAAFATFRTLFERDAEAAMLRGRSRSPQALRDVAIDAALKPAFEEPRLTARLASKSRLLRDVVIDDASESATEERIGDALGGDLASPGDLSLPDRARDRTVQLHVLASRVNLAPDPSGDAEVAATLVLQALIDFEESVGSLAPGSISTIGANWEAYRRTHSVDPAVQSAVLAGLAARNQIIHGLKGMEVSIDELLEFGERLDIGTRSVRAVARPRGTQPT